MRQTLYKLSFFMLLFFTATTLTAQQNKKFHVQSFEQAQFDTSARDKATEKIDGNGDRYAIIKVTSTKANDDLLAYNFDFGMMNSLIEQHDDELWVYVQRNAKHVTIKRAGYNPVRNYNLQVTVQPGQVFNMVLSPEAEKIQKQWVYFKISPADTKATIMYKENTPGATEESLGNVDENGELSWKFTLGRYVYRIISRDYHGTEGMLIIDNPNETKIEEITLRPKFASVTLNADAATEIYIDGELKGSGTWNGRLNKGSYNVECRKKGHKSTFETITIEEGKNVQYTLLQPTPIVGSLSIASSPLSAQITIDGKDYGTTPRNISDLLIGSHKVALSKQGYTTATVDVVINEGETTEESVTLEKQEVKNNAVASGTTASDVTTAVDINTHITVSKPRDPNELLCIACANKNDGSIAYFTGAQWEGLTANEKSQYAQLGVSIKEDGHEFIIAAIDCNNSEELKFGGYGVDFEGVINHDENSVISQFINTGYSDTKAIVEQQRGKKDEKGIVGTPAAEAAWSYKANEYDKLQWYLPSVSELQMIYRNKEAINKFLTKYIIDWSYKNNIVGSAAYWSSSENSTKCSWSVFMYSGPDDSYIRTRPYLVRAVATVDIVKNEGEITKKNSVDTREYVDLGLPSGTKWATCNVGASKPEEYGDYYAWGETETKSDYSWSTYKWCKGSVNTITKYCTDKSDGTVVNKTVLDPEDDVAHLKWGGNWRMPTTDEIKELNDKCKWKWTTLNGVNGYKVTGPNGNSIFLPAAAFRDGVENRSRGTCGNYWSSLLHSHVSSVACGMVFDRKSRNKYGNYSSFRYIGLTVRPVTK